MNNNTTLLIVAGAIKMFKTSRGALLTLQDPGCLQVVNAYRSLSVLKTGEQYSGKTKLHWQTVE